MTIRVDSVKPFYTRAPCCRNRCPDRREAGAQHQYAHSTPQIPGRIEIFFRLWNLNITGDPRTPVYLVDISALGRLYSNPRRRANSSMHSRQICSRVFARRTNRRAPIGWIRPAQRGGYNHRTAAPRFDYG